MGDHSQSNSHDLLLRFANASKACKSFLSKCYQQKSTIFLNKPGNQHKTEAIEDDAKFTRFKIRMPTKKHHRDREVDGSRSHAGTWDHHHHDDHDDDVKSPGLTRLMRNLSLRNRSHTLSRASLSKSQSQRDEGAAALPSLSRNTSRGPIIFSSSNGLMKPPAMEMQLECTLEELCFGCIKTVSIKRDVVKDNGHVVEEDEMVTIKVEPGWTKGTKITFEGKGSQKPGTEAADVIFVIAEEEHTLFKREEDDLQMGVEIPLVDALTGCTLLLPLLGGETMSLVLEEIVHPGYEKAILGEGMPKQHDPGRRGNLIVNVSVKFPEALTEEQRYNAAVILQQHC